MTLQVLDIQFNPYTSGALVTCGVKHIKFWTYCGNMLTGKKGIFGTAGKPNFFLIVLCHSFNLLTQENYKVCCALVVPQQRSPMLGLSVVMYTSGTRIVFKQLSELIL